MRSTHTLDVVEEFLALLLHHPEPERRRLYRALQNLAEELREHNTAYHGACPSIAEKIHDLLYHAMHVAGLAADGTDRQTHYRTATELVAKLRAPLLGSEPA